MNIKDLIENIIEDLTNDVDMSRIMLKVQAIAFELNNEQFSTWIYNEQNGYKNNLPDYRKVTCAVKVNLSIPYRGFLNNVDVPIDAIPNDEIRKLLSKMFFFDSISILDNYGKENNNNSLKASVPAFTFYEIGNLFPNCNIEEAWQFTDVSSAFDIVNKVKSSLLGFFLKLNKEVDFGIDFNVMINKSKIQNIMNQIINASIVNTGNGDIKTDNSNIIGGQNNNITINSEVKQKIEDLIKQIRDVEQTSTADKNEILEIIDNLQNELNKKMPMPNVIKTCLRALKSFSTIIAKKSIEIGIDKILTSVF